MASKALINARLETEGCQRNDSCISDGVKVLHLHAGLIGPLPDFPPLLASKMQLAELNHTGELPLLAHIIASSKFIGWRPLQT